MTASTPSKVAVSVMVTKLPAERLDVRSRPLPSEDLFAVATVVAYHTTSMDRLVQLAVAQAASEGGESIGVRWLRDPTLTIGEMRLASTRKDGACIATEGTVKETATVTSLGLAAAPFITLLLRLESATPAPPPYPSGEYVSIGRGGRIAVSTSPPMAKSRDVAEETLCVRVLSSLLPSTTKVVLTCSPQCVVGSLFQLLQARLDQLAIRVDVVPQSFQWHRFHVAGVGCGRVGEPLVELLQPLSALVDPPCNILTLYVKRSPGRSHGGEPGESLSIPTGGAPSGNSVADGLSDETSSSAIAAIGALSSSFSSVDGNRRHRRIESTVAACFSPPVTEWDDDAVGSRPSLLPSSKDEAILSPESEGGLDVVDMNGESPQDRHPHPQDLSAAAVLYGRHAAPLPDLVPVSGDLHDTHDDCHTEWNSFSSSRFGEPEGHSTKPMTASGGASAVRNLLTEEFDSITVTDDGAGEDTGALDPTSSRTLEYNGVGGGAHWCMWVLPPSFASLLTDLSIPLCSTAGGGGDPPSFDESTESKDARGFFATAYATPPSTPLLLPLLEEERGPWDGLWDAEITADDWERILHCMDLPEYSPNSVLAAAENVVSSVGKTAEVSIGTLTTWTSLMDVELDLDDVALFSVESGSPERVAPDPILSEDEDDVDMLARRPHHVQYALPNLPPPSSVATSLDALPLIVDRHTALRLQFSQRQLEFFKQQATQSLSTKTTTSATSLPPLIRSDARPTASVVRVRSPGSVTEPKTHETPEAPKTTSPSRANEQPASTANGATRDRKAGTVGPYSSSRRPRPRGSLPFLLYAPVSLSGSPSSSVQLPSFQPTRTHTRMMLPVPVPVSPYMDGATSTIRGHVADSRDAWLRHTTAPHRADVAFRQHPAARLLLRPIEGVSSDATLERTPSTNHNREGSSSIMGVRLGVATGASAPGGSDVHGGGVDGSRLNAAAAASPSFHHAPATIHLPSSSVTTVGNTVISPSTMSVMDAVEHLLRERRAIDERVEMLSALLKSQPLPQNQPPPRL